MNHAHNSTTLMHHLLLALALAQPTAPPTPPPPVPTFPPSMTTPAPSEPTAPPGLQADVATIDLHPGQSTTVAVTSAAPPVNVTVDAKIATANLGADGRLTVVAGTQTGKSALHLTDASGAHLDIPLRVMLDALASPLPQFFGIKVTGDAGSSFVQSQIAAAIARAASLRPGATLSISTPLPVATPSAGVETFTTNVTISGNGTYFDSSAGVNATVTTIATTPFAPPVLFYDDDPEKVSADGVLYRGVVSPTQPARLYYYHQVVGAPRRIVLALTSAQQGNSEIQVTDATAGPNVDVMTVGHAVTRNFLDIKPRNQGVVFDLGAGQPLAVHDITGTNKEVVAGNVDLRVLSGAPVSVTVLAVSPGVDAATLIGGPQLPGDGHHRTGIFDLASIGLQNVYFTAGGANASFTYGAREHSPGPIDGSTGTDYGDYGVRRSIAFTLTNPTAQTSTAYLYFRPLGGVVRSSFLIDGTLKELGCVRVASPYQLASFDLTPNSTSRVVVDTMTDGGSNYPAEVGFSSAAPTPSPPPISAPDGCFPKPQSQPSPQPSSQPSPQAQGSTPP